MVKRVRVPPPSNRPYAGFRYGYEDPQVNAANGSLRLPGSALRSLMGEVATVIYRLDDARGDALRIYARQFDGDLQYALALRNP